MCLYLGVAFALPLRVFTRMPEEVFRKLLHGILLGALLLWKMKGTPGIWRPDWTPSALWGNHASGLVRP